MSNTHNNNQSKVCLLCLKYIPQFKHAKGKKVQVLTVSESYEEKIRSTFFSEYRFSDERWPKVVCSSCKPKLCEAIKGNIRRSWCPYDIQPILMGKVSRSTAKNCSCQVCRIVQSSTKFETIRSVFQSKKKSNNKNVATEPLCSKCLSKIAKGKRHFCTRSTLIKNVEVLATEKQVDDIVASATLRKRNNESQTITLKNARGKRSTVYLSKPPEIPTLTLQDVVDIEQDQSSSSRKSKRLLTKLRKKGVKTEANIPAKLQSMTDEIASFFTVEQVLIEVGDKKNRTLTERTLVYCNRLNEYVKYIISKRGLSTSEIITKIGCDAGGNSLKVGMSIVPVNSPNANQKGKLYSGVKKIQLISLIDNTPETYFNVKLIFHKMNLRDPGLLEGQTWIVGDFKMTNNMMGLQEHSCSFPCAFCDLHKDLLRSGKDCYTMRTFGMIKMNHQAWKKSGENDKQLSLFKNCVEVPIFDEVEDFAPVLDIIAPGELHLMTGVTMHILKIIRKLDPDGFDAWIKSLCITADARSGDYNGNSIKKILNNSQKLKNFLDSSMHYFADILGSLKNLVESCFGYNLDTKYEEKLEHFRWIVNANDIPFTPKLHILLEHVPEFLAKHNIGLAAVSEQALESLHHQWKNFFCNYKLSSTSDGYASALIRGVTKFNAKNI